MKKKIIDREKGIINIQNLPPLTKKDEYYMYLHNMLIYEKSYIRNI